MSVLADCEQSSFLFGLSGSILTAACFLCDAEGPRECVCVCAHACVCHVCVCVRVCGCDVAKGVVAPRRSAGGVMLKVSCRELAAVCCPPVRSQRLPD